VDKNTIKLRSIPLEAPYTAAALHRFLSDHPKDAGVKIEGAFRAPLLKVRKDGPTKLDENGRAAWGYYLRYLHQRLVGTEQADRAAEEIDALLKKEPLKLSVGALLVPLDALMKAEQARLASANSLVKRWLANEKGVQDIAIGHGRDDETKEKLGREKAALETACKFLARFSDCKDGEIDTNRILDEAYEIGHQLSKEDIDSLAIARQILMGKKTELSAFIGPETASFLDLCISASGKDKKDFRSDTHTKTVVAVIATAMKARTDTDEYLIPASPRTIASRTNVRASIPEFTAANTATPDRASRRASDKEEERREASATPPRKTPPATPKRGSPDDESSLARGHSASELVSPSGARRNAPALTTASHPSGMSATVRELQGLQRPALRKVITSPVEQGSTTNMAVPPLASLASSSPDTTAMATPDKPRQLRRSSMRSRTPSSEDSRSGQASAIVSETGSEKKPGKESRRKRGLEKESASSGASRQRSQGEEVSTVRTRMPHSARSKHSSMPTPGGLDPDNAESVQHALAELKAAATAAKADRQRPRMDTPLFKKWEAAEKELQSVLTLETSHAMRRILSFCHEVSLNPGEELASMQRVVRAARPRSKEIAALVAVRDTLLAESRQQASSKVSASFPELLSLLVFLMDADRAWRQDRAAKGSEAAQ
jgi:hypothetical protein